MVTKQSLYVNRDDDSALIRNLSLLTLQTLDSLVAPSRRQHRRNSGSQLQPLTGRQSGSKPAALRPPLYQY